MTPPITIRGQVRGQNRRESVDLGGGGAVVTNLGPATVYYRDEQYVDDVTNDGSLAASASVTLAGTQFFTVVAASAVPSDTAVATIQFVDVPVSAGSGSGLPGGYVPGPAPSGDTTGATDAAAIQAAMVGLAATGGKVLLQAGTYWLNAKLYPVSRVTLEGAGSNATILKSAAGYVGALFKENDGLEYSWWVRHLQFNGNRANQTVDASVALVSYTRGSKLTGSPTQPPFLVSVPTTFGGDLLGIEDVIVANVRGTGVDVYGAGMRISDLLVFDVAGNGLRGFLVDSEFSNIEVGSTGLNGVLLEGQNLRWTGMKACGTSKTDSTTAMINLTGNQNQLSAIEGQEGYGHGLIVSGNDNRIDGLIEGAAYSGLVLSGTAQRNDIDVTLKTFNNGFGGDFQHQYALRIPAGATPTENRIQLITGTPTVGLVYGDPTGNELVIGGGRDGVQTLAYAATVTVNPLLGERVALTVTGACRIQAPEFAHKGQRLTLAVTQDTTGGRTVTFDNTFKLTDTVSTTARDRTTISFRYDGSGWVQDRKAVIQANASPSQTDPTTIPGLQGRWRGQDITGPSDGQAVVTVPDGSGSGRTLIADTASGVTAPTYKTGIINGKAVMRFAGAQSMRVDDVLQIGRQCTLIVACALGASTQGALVSVGGDNGVALGTGSNIFDVAGNEVLGLLNNVGWADVNGTYAAGNHVLTLVADTDDTGHTTITLRRDGNVLGTATLSLMTRPSTRLTVGSIFPGSGHARFATTDIAEVLAYDRALSAAECSAAERALGTDYAITVA